MQLYSRTPVCIGVTLAVLATQSAFVCRSCSGGNGRAGECGLGFNFPHADLMRRGGISEGRALWRAQQRLPMARKGGAVAACRCRVSQGDPGVTQACCRLSYWTPGEDRTGRPRPPPQCTGCSNKQRSRLLSAGKPPGGTQPALSSARSFIPPRWTVSGAAAASPRPG